MLESQHHFECGKCHGIFHIDADREQYHAPPKPVRCQVDDECRGNRFTLLKMEMDIEQCKDYQEIRVQEQITHLEIGKIPHSTTVLIENDLVDSCKAGDDIWITAIVTRRWKPLWPSMRCDAEICLFSNNILVNNQRQTTSLSDEQRSKFTQFWIDHASNPLVARDKILASFCPSVYGMYLVKLAALLVLAGGVGMTQNGTVIRGDAHLLLVGDPGTAKSKFLRYAASVSPRAVLTTGIGTTSAGLTCTAVKDSG